MKRALFVAALTASLAGCGLPPVGFVNKTPHSDAYLMARWTDAQQAIATTSIRINAIESGPPVYIAPDAAALKIQPRAYLVEAQTDATPEQVFAAAGFYPQNIPTGFIVCPMPCDVKADWAYSTPYGSTHYAASWDHNPGVIEGLLTYEFENAILYQLHYNMSGR